MTAPDPSAVPLGSEVPSTPPPSAPETGGRPLVRAVDGNRAALALLVGQNVVAAVLTGLGLPLGMALLGSVVVNVALGLTLFRPTVTALLQDPRWRTRPDWGVALGAFVLAFVASRAFIVAFLALVPNPSNAGEQFLSHGVDVGFMLLAAGLLVPFLEEVAFRGLMMRGHEHARGFGLAAVTSSAAFALAHGIPMSVVGILPLAYVLARVVQHTGSLWSSVIIHALNNLVAVGIGVFLNHDGQIGDAQGEASRALDTLQDPALKTPVVIGAALFGSVLMLVAHLWLKPKPDATVGARPGPWLSGAYAVIVLFGLAALAYSVPAVREFVTELTAR